MGRQFLPREWQDYGARFGRDGRLYLAEWRKGFTVHELRALFFESQLAHGLHREAATLRRDLDAATVQLDAAERAAAFYRRQLVAESRLGMALTRIID